MEQQNIIDAGITLDDPHYTDGGSAFAGGELMGRCVFGDSNKIAVLASRKEHFAVRRVLMKPSLPCLFHVNNI